MFIPKKLKDMTYSELIAESVGRTVQGMTVGCSIKVSSTLQLLGLNHKRRNRMSDEDVLYLILEDMEAPIDLHTLRLLLQRDDYPSVSWETACRMNESFRETSEQPQ